MTWRTSSRWAGRRAAGSLPGAARIGEPGPLGAALDILTLGFLFPEGARPAPTGAAFPIGGAPGSQSVAGLIINNFGQIITRNPLSDFLPEGAE